MPGRGNVGHRGNLIIERGQNSSLFVFPGEARIYLCVSAVLKYTQHTAAGESTLGLSGFKFDPHRKAGDKSRTHDSERVDPDVFFEDEKA